jgi:glycosyltransferase involved in cell wall biosynthesis
VAISVRVLFVTHNVPRCEGDAAGSFVLRLAVALQAAGARVDIIAPGAPGLMDVDRIEGVTIQRVRYARADRMTLAYTGNMAQQVLSSLHGKIAFVRLLRGLRRAVRSRLDAAAASGEPYHVVHAHWWFPAGLALWGAQRRGDPPLVITMHGSDVRLAQQLRPAHRVMRSVLGQARVRTAVSSWLAQRVSTIAPALPVIVSPMPVDVRHFSTPAPTDRQAEPTRRGVLFVGRLNAQKGLTDLLDAMASAPLASPAAMAVPLDIVGDGPDGPALQQRAASLGLTDRVRWHGALAQPALVSLYQQAQVLVIPSREEGLGLVAVEAQLCGTPVVAYADGGVVDVVQTAHGGTLVPVGDVAALAAAIAHVLADPAEAHARGAKGRAAMYARFAPATVAERYLSHYREAIG